MAMNVHVCTYIKYNLVPGGVGKDDGFPIATILTFFLCFIHFHDIIHRYMSVYSLFFFYNVTDLVRECMPRKEKGNKPFETFNLCTISMERFGIVVLFILGRYGFNANDKFD